MGNKKNKYIICLILLMLVAGLFVYRQPESVKVTKTPGLQSFLERVPGYQVSPATPLDDATYTLLELDDYIQTRYQRNGQVVDLYVGYYFTSDKVSAAHSPLVCFPGQGWTLSTPSQHSMQVGNNVINYEEMTATLEQRQDLVLYWYQAHEKTVTKIYQNKLNALWNQLSGKKQEHAFVRVSIPIGQSGPEESRKFGRDFMEAFYPVFLAYINSPPRLLNN